MKNIFSSFALIVLFGGAAYSQASNWQWAKTATCTANGVGEGWANCLDASGNLISTGYYTGQLTFGSTVLIDPNGNYGVFLAKYTSSGNLLWAKKCGGMGDNWCYCTSADSDDNIYITGAYYGLPTMFGSNILLNAGSYDAFIAKYDSSGNVLWAKGIGSAGAEISYGIKADANGDVIITGIYTSPSITIDTITLINADTITGNTYDIFVAKFDSSGNALWAKRIGGKTIDGGLNQSVCIDAGNNIIITGSFQSDTLTFGSTVLTNADTSGYSRDILIAKYDAQGNELWAKSGAGASYEGGNSVSVDVNNNILVTGYFKSDSIALDGIVLHNAGVAGCQYGCADMFVAKYNSSGNILWAKSEGGSNNDIGYSIGSDTSGNIFVSGGFFSPYITIGAITLIPPVSNCWAPCDPLFVVKYNSAGNVICASELASGGDDFNGISVDQSGNAYITGDFLSVPFIVGTDTFNLTGLEDAFSAKFNCQATGINTLYKENSLNIYPNPTTSNITITSTSIITHLKITNTLGQVVYQTKSNDKSIEVKLFDEGMYFVQLTADKETVTQKVMVVKN